MRLTPALLGPAVLSLAAIAAAQAPRHRQPTPPPAPPAQQQGLSGLEDTVNQLQDTPAAEAPAAAPAPAQAAPARPARPRTIVPLSQQAEEEHAAFARAVQRGRLLGAIAQAGQIGTQDMLAHVSNPDEAGITGWIAVPEANAVTVIFYGPGANGGPPVSVYRVSIVGGRVTGRQTFLTGTRPPLGPHEARMAAARAATDALDHHPCGGDEFNVFVVPPAAPDAPIDVYQLSPQTARGSFPLGGHFKSTIAPDGHVVSSSALAGTCGTLAAPAAAAGQEPRPLSVTDADDPLPTELHVFLSIWSRHPLVVAAGEPRRMFAVTGEGIAPVRQ
ncbi:MAG: hypothetical protein JO276_09250 [Sphingomonadaceae bacterium]|nr:hypothetical protein [Sphingomonadaceae bacterium]